MKKLKLLLVDDHKIVRDGLKIILGSDDELEIVAEASSGVEAIKYLENEANNIDVILMDISMPELNGLDATEIITKLHPNVRILALTMHDEESYIIDMLKAGASGYILKDTSSDKLIEAIKVVSEGKNYYSNGVSTTIIKSLLSKSNEKQENAKSKLSDREIRVMKEVSKGATNVEIAKILEISNRTVETHRRNILKKLNLKNTAEMINYAIRKGIVE